MANREDAATDRNRFTIESGANGSSPKLVPVNRHRPLRAIHSAAGDDNAADGVAHRLRHSTYKQLAVNDLPAVDYPVIQVTCSYPGANPETMANTIATPLEKQFPQIPGLDIITSSSTQGNTNITLQFDLDKSIIDAATDVQAAIQRATGQLPNDLPSPPTFQKTNPNDQPVMYHRV